MQTEHNEQPAVDLRDQRIQRAISELKGLISSRYPMATFAVSLGDDPEGVYLTATVDVEDTDAVMDVVIDRLLELQVDEGLPVYVVPIRPLERVLAEMRRAEAHRGPNFGVASL
jgi:hypothetical protein